MRVGTCLLNFARDEIVDSTALVVALDSGKLGKYISDFPRPELMDRENVISMPHIGASTREAEENFAFSALECQGGKRGFGNGGPAKQALSDERATAREAEKFVEFSVLECTRKNNLPWSPVLSGVLVRFI